MRVLIVEDEPHMAEAIHDGLRLEAIAADIAALSKIKGVGKKTAERIVLELKDKLEGVMGAAPSAAGSPRHVIKKGNVNTPTKPPILPMAAAMP